MAKRTTVLKVSGLKRAFGPNTIFDGFNLEVRAGEAIALTGRNGAGKSTLLRCLVGADRPDDGTIEVLGTPMSETSPEIRRNVATVIDDLDFFPDLSVVEHLDLLARAHGQDDPDAMVDEVLDEVQLVPQAGQLPGTLSSGQRRRLALATAFVRPRKLLIMDEPEQRLDVEGVAWLSQRLQAERKSGLAIVFASHEPSLVEIGRHPGGPARRGAMSTADATGDAEFREYPAHHDAGFEGPEEPAHLAVPSAAELKGLIRDWRKGRATRNLWEAFSRRLHRRDRRADDRRCHGQRGHPRPAGGLGVQLRVVPVRPYRAALGRAGPGRGSRAGRLPVVRPGAGLGRRGLLAARHPRLAGPGCSARGWSRRWWRRWSSGP